MLATIFFHSDFGAPRAIAGHVISNEAVRLLRDGSVERTVTLIVGGQAQTVTTNRLYIVEGDHGQTRPRQYAAFCKAELDSLVASAMEKGCALLFDSQEYAGNVPAMPRQNQVIGNLLRERLAS